MPNLEKKLEILIYHKKFVTPVSPNYPLLLNIKLDRNKTILISVALNWITKLSMGKYFVSFTFIKSTIKKIRISHKDKVR